ncbi:putative IMP dehydrogenase/GMP reductase, partial [Trifolium pratense]
MIMSVSNGGKMNSIVYFVNDFKWWHATMDTIGMYGLELTGYSFLDPALLSTFVERWHGETSSFHMPSGKMTVTLDDVRYLLHLPIKGRLLDHK